MDFPTDTPNVTAEQALNLVRDRWRETNRPVPGYGAPEDTIGNSYRQEEHGTGWIFRPAVAGLDRDPRLAAFYPLFVVTAHGAVAKISYASGISEAQALLDEQAS